MSTFLYLLLALLLFWRIGLLILKAAARFLSSYHNVSCHGLNFHLEWKSARLPTLRLTFPKAVFFSVWFETANRQLSPPEDIFERHGFERWRENHRLLYIEVDSLQIGTDLVLSLNGVNITLPRAQEVTAAEQRQLYPDGYPDYVGLLYDFCRKHSNLYTIARWIAERTQIKVCDIQVKQLFPFISGCPEKSAERISGGVLPPNLVLDVDSLAISATAFNMSATTKGIHVRLQHAQRGDEMMSLRQVVCKAELRNKTSLPTSDDRECWSDFNLRGENMVHISCRLLRDYHIHPDACSLLTAFVHRFQKVNDNALFLLPLTQMSSIVAEGFLTFLLDVAFSVLNLTKNQGEHVVFETLVRVNCSTL